MSLKVFLKVFVLNCFIFTLFVFSDFAKAVCFDPDGCEIDENEEREEQVLTRHLKNNTFNQKILKAYGVQYSDDIISFSERRDASKGFKNECLQLYGDFSRNIQNLFQSDISPSSTPGTQSLDSYIDQKREQCKDQIVESYRKIESIDLKGYNSKKQRDITIFYSWREAYKNIKQPNLEGSRDIQNFITHYEKLKNNECYKKGLREAPGEISKWNLDKDDLEEFLEYSAKENCWDLKNKVLAFIENKNRKGTWSKVQSKFKSCINTASLDCVKNLYSGPSGGGYSS